VNLASLYDKFLIRSPLFGKPGLQGLWLPLASIALQPSQPLLRIPNLRNTRVSVFTEGEDYCVYFVDSLPYLCILTAIGIRLSIYIMLITNFADCGALFQKAFSLMKLATDPSRLASLPA
jgi:hypothetical protein